MKKVIEQTSRGIIKEKSNLVGQKYFVEYNEFLLNRAWKSGILNKAIHYLIAKIAALNMLRNAQYLVAKRLT